MKNKFEKTKRKSNFSKLTTEFVLCMPNRMSLITNSIEDKEYQVTLDESHKFKGIAGAFGFHEITDSSGAL